MSTTFFAPDAPAATEHLEFNISSTNAGELTTFVGLDTRDAIGERGMVAGEFPAAEVVAAVRSHMQGEIRSNYIAARMRDLLALAEEANRHGSTVAWA